MNNEDEQEVLENGIKYWEDQITILKFKIKVLKEAIRMRKRLDEYIGNEQREDAV